MAEFERDYCTGCGVKAKRWGHRPFCWRYMSMKYDLEPTHKMRQRCLREMEKHWRIRSLFIVKRKHMYYQYGEEKSFSPVIVTPARGPHG